MKTTVPPLAWREAGAPLRVGTPQGPGGKAPVDAWYEPAATWIPDSSTASNCDAGIVFSSLTTGEPAVVPHQSSVVPWKYQSAPLSARTSP